MKNLTSNSLRCISPALVLLCLTLATGAQAGTITKLGTGTDLTAGASWNGGTAPGSGDAATWASTSLGTSLTLGSAASWGSLSVGGALSDIGITGAGTLTLGGLDMTSSTVNMSIANPLTLSASQTWNVNSGKTLISSGIITGTGTVLTKSGSGTLTLSGASTYTGGTTLSAGQLNINYGGSSTANSAIGMGPLSIAGGTIDVTAPAPVSIITVQPTTLPVYFDGDFTFNATRSLQFRGATAFSLRNGSRKITVNNTPASGYYFNINGPLSEIGGSWKLTKDGPGWLHMGAVNTFTGGFSLKAGHMTMVSGNSLGTTAGTFSIDGPSTIGSFSGTVQTLSAMPQAWNADFGCIKFGLNLGTGTVTLGGNRTVSVDNGLTLTVGGPIGDGGHNYTLTKVGPGTLSLRGASTYGGATTAQQGTLLLDYSTAVGSKIPDASGLVLGGGTITLSGGGTAHNEVVASTTVSAGASAVTRASGTSVLRMNAITRNAGGTVDFGAASIADTDTSNVNGILRGYATVGGADWALSATSASDTAITALAAGSYTAMVAGATSDTANDSTGSLTLSGNHSHNSLKVTTGATLDLGTSSLTLASGGLLSVGSGASTISGTASPGLIGGNNGSGGYELIVHQYNTAGLTISAILGNNGANATALTKSGSSTLTLSGANTYTGGTYINAGTVSISADGNLGGTAGTVYLNGGTLANTVSINPLNASRGIDLGPNGGTLSAAASTTFAIAGQVTGTGQLMTAGTGVVNLGATTTPNNTYSGGTYVSSGSVLCVGNDAALGSSGSGITLDGGTLENWSDGPGDPNFTSSRTITVNTPLNGYLDAGNSQNLTVSSKITGAGALGINQASGLVILKNTGNDYLSGTTIGWPGPGYQSGGTAATLQLGASEVIPNGPGKGNVSIFATYQGKLDLAGYSETINGLTFDGTVDNSTGNGTLIVGDWDATASFSGVIQNSGGTLALTKIGAGTQTLSGVNTYIGGTTISAGTLTLGGSGSLGGGSYAGNIANSGTFTYNSSASQALSGVISGTGALIQSAGTLTLSGLNTYSGGTTLSAGQLNINNGGSETGGIGTSAIGNGPLSIAGGTVDVTAASSVTVRPYANLNMYFDGDFTYNCTRSLQFRGATKYYLRNGSRTITVNNTPGSTYMLNINGAIYEAGGTGYKLTKAGTGRLYLNPGSPASSFSGGVSLQAGHLSFGVGSSKPLGTGTFSIDGLSTIGATSTTALTVNHAWNADFGVAQYAGDFGNDITSVNLGTGTVTLGGNRQVTVNSGLTLTVGGVIGDGGHTYTLTKAGPGIMILGGANTYAGGTIINAGTLDGSVSSSIPDNVTVSAGALQLDNSSAMSSSATLTLADAPGAGAVNLNFSGMQTIGALYFGSTQKAAGTWGAIGSGATHQNAAFTGAGLLNVTSGGATPSIALSDITTVCDGSPVSLTASVSGGSSPSGSVQFFDNATSLGTQPLSGGSATKLVSLSAGTHANVTATYLGDDNNNPSTSGAKSAVVIAESADPASATASVSPICAGGATTLTLNGGGGGNNETIQWFTDSCGGTAAGTGNGLSVSPATTTTYYGRYEDGAPCNYNSACASVTVVVNPAATASAISGATSVASGQMGSGYSATPPNGTSTYAWTLPTGAAIAGPSTGPSITVNWGTASSGDVTVTETTVASCVGSPVSLAVTVTDNHAPVAPAAKTLSTAKNTASTFAKAKLLAGATDADSGDTLSVSAAASPSAQGGTVTLEADDVKYTPATDFTGADSYTYTISDGNGGTAIGTVDVTVTENSGISPNVVDGPTYANGKFSVTFAGIPGYVYTVEYAEGAAAPPWTKLENVTAGSDGLFVVEDTVGQSPSRYYRTVYPSYP